MNGAVNLYIPLLSLPQRGGYPLSLAYVHHSNLNSPQQNMGVSSSVGAPDHFTYNDSIAHQDQPLEINLPRLQFTSEYFGDHAYPDSVTNIFCATNFVFTDWNGNKHPFENTTTCNSRFGGTVAELSDLTDSSDGSFYRLDTSTPTDIKVYAKDGTLYHFYGYFNPYPNTATMDYDVHNNNEAVYDGRSGLIVDPNGNQISIQTTLNTYPTPPSYTVTDTLGRIIGITPTGVSYYDSNGNPQQITVTTTPSSETTNFTYLFSCQNPQSQYISASTVANYTNLPTSTEVTIAFPPSNGGGNKTYSLQFDPIKRISKIEYPTGGYTRYDYNDEVTNQNLVLFTPANMQCTSNLAEVAHKYECSSSNGSCGSEQTTTYQATMPSSGAAFNASMSVTNPLGGQEVHNFSTTNRTRTNPQESSVTTYDASGALIRTVQKYYPSIAPPGAGQYSYDITFPTQVTTTLNDISPAISTTTTYQYEPYTATLPYAASVILDNPTEIDTTDYSGTTISKISQQWEPASAFTSSNHILDRLYYRTVTDPILNLSHTTTNGYDTSGNVTSVTINGTGTGSYTTQYPRNSYGEIHQIIDPKNNTTTIGYTDAWSSSGQSCVAANTSAYPTTVTNQLGQVTSYTYNACTGTLSASTDPNNATTAYTYDALNRVLCTTVKDSNNVLYSSVCDSYNDGYSSTITHTIAQDSTNNITSQSLLDGYGRIQQTQLSDPSGPDVTYFTYDQLGRKQSVSNPYRSTGDPTYGITSYLYDALNRVIDQCQSDNTTTPSTTCVPTNSYLKWKYTGNVTDLYDETGRHWQQTDDALGRLIKVLEPDGSTSTTAPPILETDYQYTAFGDLTHVSQSGRVRFFTYDGLSRLLTAANPESGTICYGVWSSGTCINGYDANSNLIARTDARGIQTTFSYDGLNRLIAKTYSDGTPAAYFQYDQTGAFGAAACNPQSTSFNQCNTVGRLDYEYTGDEKTGTAFSYDSAGRVSMRAVCTPANCGTSHYTLLSGHDMAGELTSYTDGNSYTISTSYDTAGRATVVSSSMSDPAHPRTLWTANTYGPVGLTQATQGNGLIAQQTYDRRMRLQSSTLTNASNTLLYNLYVGYFPNGSIQSAVDSANGSWSYNYDNLNRVYSANATTGPYAGAGLQWSFDVFGNRTSQVATAGSAPQPSAAYNANNQIVGDCYDASGNLLDQGGCPINGAHAYSYDGEGRQASVSQANYTYVYDAEGRRSAKLVNGAVTYDFLYDQDGHIINEPRIRSHIYAQGRNVAVYYLAETSFPQVDWLGNLRLLTAIDGTVQQTCNNMPYGDAQSCTGSLISPDYFTGKWRDGESANDYFGARYYASSMGRFMSADPSGLYYADPSNPQSLNLYSYGGNNPLTNIDPTGLDCVHINNDTGKFEGFESGDCNNSTEALANTGHYVDGTVNQISFNGQGQVSGYSASTSDGFFDTPGSNSGPLAANYNPYTGAVSGPVQSVTVNGQTPVGPDTSSLNITNQIPANGLQRPSNIAVMRAYHPPAPPELTGDGACYGAPGAVSEIHNIRRGIYQSQPQASTDGVFGVAINQRTQKGDQQYGNAAADTGFNAGFMGLDYAISVGNCLQGH